MTHTETIVEIRIAYMQTEKHELREEYARKLIQALLTIADEQAATVKKLNLDVSAQTNLAGTFERAVLAQNELLKEKTIEIERLMKERDEARKEACEQRDSRLYISDREFHEVDCEDLITQHRYEFPLPWEKVK